MSDEQLLPVEAPTPPSGRRHTVALKNLLLDPNNYRFIDQPEYVEVELGKVADGDVQRRTAGFILGQNNEEVRDLIASFKKNGWLPVDQIQVRQITPGKYLVVEGNRRVAALKHLERRYEEGGIDLGSLDPLLFKAVPVVFYEDAGDAHHLVVMGLGHISGKKRWPAVNQARLLHSLIYTHEWREDDVVNAVGISKRELRSTLKTLGLCDLYKESDYGDQFTPEKYNIFREVVRSREINGWLDLSQQDGKPRNEERMWRLFSWVSREEDSINGDDDQAGASSDPVISTGTDIRELAKIINDEKALRILDETRRLTDAAILSDVVVKDRIAAGLAKINDTLGMLFHNSAKLQDVDLAQAEEAMKKLRGLLAARDRQPALLGDRLERRAINQARSGHFSSLNIKQFKRLNFFEVSDLRRINLFVGPNNTGKTTLLEAINLIVAQNDVDELLRIVCRRGKVLGDPPALWVKDQIQADAHLSGTFDTISENLASVSIRNIENGEGLDDKTFYVTSIEIDSKYAGQHQTAVTHLFEQRERITQLESVQVLCPVVFSSPFTQHDTEVLVELFNRSVDAKSKDDVIAFIQEYLDAGFQNVDAAPAQGSRSFTRFRVTHQAFESACDLAQFGEGVQRIFQISLLFAYAKGGVVLIDEFENAIHFSLLRHFTRLIQQLAEKFDTQVFLTSHSKECVDAFVENGSDLQEVSAYALRVEEGIVRSYDYSGERLKRMIDAVDIDIRGTSPTPPK